MNPAELAQMLDLMAQALRAMSSAPGQPAPATSTEAPARTLADWLDVHEAQVLGKGYKVQTVRNRGANIRHVRRLWGSRPIGALRAHEIVTAIRAEFLPDKSSTAQRVLFELREAYAEAIANDWTQQNPAASVKLPTHRVKRKRLSLETWIKMRTLSHVSGQPWLECLLLLALVTGQRRADLVKMRFTDVVDGYLHIEQQKEAGKGYGARIALPLTLRMDAIGMSLADVIEQCRGCARPGETLLRKAGGGGIEQSSLSARFHESIVAVLGPDAHSPHEWPSLHEVRSLSARLYRDQGIDVQTLLGHRHAEMTAIYVDDRGLSAGTWKRLDLRPVPAPAGQQHPVNPFTLPR